MNDFKDLEITDEQFKKILKREVKRLDSKANVTIKTNSDHQTSYYFSNSNKEYIIQLTKKKNGKITLHCTGKHTDLSEKICKRVLEHKLTEDRIDPVELKREPEQDKDPLNSIIPSVVKIAPMQLKALLITILEIDTDPENRIYDIGLLNLCIRWFTQILILDCGIKTCSLESCFSMQNYKIYFKPILTGNLNPSTTDKIVELYSIHQSLLEHIRVKDTSIREKDIYSIKENRLIKYTEVFMKMEQTAHYMLFEKDFKI